VATRRCHACRLQRIVRRRVGIASHRNRSRWPVAERAVAAARCCSGRWTAQGGRGAVDGCCPSTPHHARSAPRPHPIAMAAAFECLCFVCFFWFFVFPSIRIESSAFAQFSPPFGQPFFSGSACFSSLGRPRSFSQPLPSAPPPILVQNVVPHLHAAAQAGDQTGGTAGQNTHTSGRQSREAQTAFAHGSASP